MPPQNSKHYQVPFGNDANFANHPGVAVIKIQPKSPKFLLDMRYFCNFSLVSLGIRPRSRRCAERTRQGEGRWSRPPKAALERSYIRPRNPVPRIAYFGRDKRTRDQIPDTKEELLCRFTRAPHGRRHSPAPMLRLGQGGTRTRKRRQSCSCSIRHYWKFKVMRRI